MNEALEISKTLARVLLADLRLRGQQPSSCRIRAFYWEVDRTRSTVLVGLYNKLKYNFILKHKGAVRERDSTNAVPPHLRRDVSSVIQAVWPPRVAVLFQFGSALLRDQREHSPGSRCSGNPTDVRPRDASLVVSQALWICSAAGGTT